MSNAGAVSLPIFSCVFTDDEGERHYNHPLLVFEEGSESLQGAFYAVCVADNAEGGERRIVAGVVLRSTCEPHDNDFVSTLGASILALPPLQDLLSSRTSLLPARLAISGQGGLSVPQMLGVLRQQRVKHQRTRVAMALVAA
jgi:hypothetical protein